MRATLSIALVLCSLAPQSAQANPLSKLFREMIEWAEKGLWPSAKHLPNNGPGSAHDGTNSASDFIINNGIIPGGVRAGERAYRNSAKERAKCSEASEHADSTKTGTSVAAEPKPDTPISHEVPTASAVGVPAHSDCSSVYVIPDRKSTSYDNLYEADPNPPNPWQTMNWNHFPNELPPPSENGEK